MLLILHCTKIKFPKPWFTVTYSVPELKLNISLFLSVYMAFNNCFLMVPWFVLSVIFIKNVYDKKSMLSLLHIYFPTGFTFGLVVLTCVFVVVFMNISLLKCLQIVQRAAKKMLPASQLLGEKYQLPLLLFCPMGPFKWSTLEWNLR